MPYSPFTTGFATFYPFYNWVCFSKKPTNVIAKEHSDCGNLNPSALKTLPRLKLALFGFVFCYPKPPKIINISINLYYY
jgi:hypothetical protein